MRALLLCEVPGPHEERFARALADGGIEATIAGVDGPVAAAAAVARVRPDVVQVGPLPLAARIAEVLPDTVGLLVVSYGWDAIAAEEEGRWDALRPAFGRAAAAMCDCAWIESRLRARLPDGVPLARFPWGVDLALFAPGGVATDPLGGAWPGRGPLILGTRRLEPLYDPLTLVGALACDAAPRGALLVLVADGSLRDRVEDEAVRLGVVDRLAIRPPVPESELPALMRAADIWVNAARADGACISLLQALACGTPVVTPDLPCPREIVDEDVGALYPPGDAAAAAAALAQVAGRISGMGPACRRRAEERADWRVHAATYRAIVAAARRGG